MNKNNLDKALDDLENLDCLDEYAYERAISYFLSIKQLPIVICEIPAQTLVFRTRTHKNDTLFSESKDISIPENKFVSNYARCNKPFQSIFYCSENRPTSFIELVEYWSESTKFNEILFATIGIWRLNRPCNVLIVTSPDHAMRTSAYDREFGSAIDEFINNYHGELKDCMIKFFRFIYEKFRKPAKDDLKTYIITSAYTNIALMHANEMCDGIFYPSVPYEQKGINVAIKRSFYEKSGLTLEEVSRTKFLAQEGLFGKHKFVEIKTEHSIKIDGKSIIWK